MEELLKHFEKQFEVLHRQRAFLMAALDRLMEKDFEEKEATVLQLAVAETFLTSLLEKDYMLGDEVEKKVLQGILSKLEREKALVQVKQSLDTPPDPF